MQERPTQTFLSVSHPSKRSDEWLRIRANAALFIKKLEGITSEIETSTPEAKSDIEKAVQNFLESCDFYPALIDFEMLRKFKSGSNERRSDGTYNIYHEIIPMINILALVAQGAENGGIDLATLEGEGGLAVMLQTIINHDVIEDQPISKDQFQNIQQERTGKTLDDLAQAKPSIYADENRRQWEMRNADLVARNVWVVSKKTVDTDANGQPVYLSSDKLSRTSRFDTMEDFLREMIHGPDANIISLSTKLLDIAHNTATFTGSKKHGPEEHGPEKILKWCNSIENLFGAREALTEEAIEKWPEHEEEIKYLDSLVGSVLYLQFGRLEYVLNAYKGVKGRYQAGDPLDKIQKAGGIGYRYLDRVCSVQIPRFASIFHVALDRERKLAETDPQVRAWLERSIYPSLVKHKEHFPEIFTGPKAWHPPENREETRRPFTPDNVALAPCF